MKFALNFINPPPDDKQNFTNNLKKKKKEKEKEKEKKKKKERKNCVPMKHLAPLTTLQS
jgi:hypothetical protein